jgi:hypothetical protein
VESAKRQNASEKERHAALLEDGLNGAYGRKRRKPKTQEEKDAAKLAKNLRRNAKRAAIPKEQRNLEHNARRLVARRAAIPKEQRNLARRAMSQEEKNTFREKDRVRKKSKYEAMTQEQKNTFREKNSLVQSASRGVRIAQLRGRQVFLRQLRTANIYYS